MISICLSGARGRMGRMLARLIIEAEDLDLAAALEAPGHPDEGVEVDPRHLPGLRVRTDAGPAIAAGQVLLDFSLPAAVAEHAAVAAEAGRPLVTGATGLDEAQRAALQQAADRVAVVLGSNMSRGVHVLTRLVHEAAGLLGPDYDVEIVETHHRHKVDAPSGTAWQLARAVQAERGGETVYGRAGRREAGDIGLSAVRGGDVVGEHEVLFLGPGEKILLAHRATTREHFCRGALDAVRFVAGRGPGLFGMDDVFGSEG